MRRRLCSRNTWSSFRSTFPPAGKSPRAIRPGSSKRSSRAHLDEERRRGTRTRLLRFDPGAFTTEPFIHDYWEEVFQLSGTLTVGGKTFGPMTYACRPPQVWHGPFSSEQGCLLLEVHFYDPL